MSESTADKIAYFRQKKEALQKAEMEFKMLLGQYNEEFSGWLKEKGVVVRNGQIDTLDIIAEFAPRT